MKVLTRYLAREFTQYFCLGLGAFSAIYLIVEFFERINAFIYNKATWPLMGAYFLNKFPSILFQVAPAAILLASIITILHAVQRYECRLVEITGGEPLVQKEVYSLIDRLIEEKFTVLLETGGSIDIGNVHPNVIRIMDLKCPSSGESGKNLDGNIDKLQPHEEIKFVIGTREDYSWAKQFVKDQNLEGKYRILFSTVFDCLPPNELAEWILEDSLNVRFQLQIHKYIWGPGRRGV